MDPTLTIRSPGATFAFLPTALPLRKRALLPWRTTTTSTPTSCSCSLGFLPLFELFLPLLESPLLLVARRGSGSSCRFRAHVCCCWVVRGLWTCSRRGPPRFPISTLRCRHPLFLSLYLVCDPGCSTCGGRRCGGGAGLAAGHWPFEENQIRWFCAGSKRRVLCLFELSIVPLVRWFRVP